MRLLLHEVFPLVMSDHHSEDPTVFLIITDGGICFFLILVKSQGSKLRDRPEQTTHNRVMPSNTHAELG